MIPESLILEMLDMPQVPIVHIDSFFCFYHFKFTFVTITKQKYENKYLHNGFQRRIEYSKGRLFHFYSIKVVENICFGLINKL